MDTTQTKQQQEKGYGSTMYAGDLAVTTVAPQDIQGICLADGWHSVRAVEFTQFAISPSASPPKPNKFYAALRYTDASSGRQVITPLSQVLGVETSSDQSQSQQSQASSRR